MANQANAVLETLTVKNNASTASLTFTRHSDGHYRFTDVDGHLVKCSSNEEIRKIFEAIAALV